MNIAHAIAIHSILPSHNQHIEHRIHEKWTSFEREVFAKIKKVIPNLSLKKESIYHENNDIHFDHFLQSGIAATKHLKEYILQYGPIFKYNPETKETMSWSELIWRKEPAELLELLTLIYKLEDESQVHQNPDFIFNKVTLPECHLDIFLHSHHHMRNALEYPRFYRPYTAKILELLVSRIPPERINNKIYLSTPGIDYKLRRDNPSGLLECLLQNYSTTTFINDRCRHPQPEHMAMAGTRIITTKLLDMLIEKKYKPNIQLSNIFGIFELQSLLMTPDVQLKYLELYEKNAAPEYIKTEKYFLDHINKQIDPQEYDLEQYLKFNKNTIFYSPVVEQKLRSIFQIPN